MPSPVPDLPREQGVEPIRALKRAILDPTNRAVPFTGLIHGSYGVDAEATCAKWEGGYFSVFGMAKPVDLHPAPAVGCTCGFYAMKDPATLDPSRGNCTLDVELLGTVIVCEHGYRAERQRVLAVRADPCPSCGGPADLIGNTKDDAWLWSCMSCAETGAKIGPGFTRFVHASALPNILQTEVVR